MTPVELQLALERTPPRSAQVLTHRLLDGRSRAACALLYGLKPEQWDVLFLRAVHDFERALGRPPRGDDSAAASLAADLSAELRELEQHRDEVKRLLEQSVAAYEASPRFTAEIWARRIAIGLIIGLTAYFYLLK